MFSFVKNTHIQSRQLSNGAIDLYGSSMVALTNDKPLSPNPKLLILNLPNVSYKSLNLIKTTAKTTSMADSQLTEPAQSTF
jgi:hypothetical protein